MHLVAVGCSHHSAPVAVRERLAFPGTQVREALQAVRRLPGVLEAVMLATCNRTEVYAVSDAPMAGTLSDFLCRAGGEEVRTHLYSYAEEAVPHHLFRVAGGVDSMVVGEGQILGQVREAARLAVEESSAGPITRRMFDSAVASGRRVRTETEIARGAVSVSHMAVELARQIFGDLRSQTVLLLGAGETAEMTARALSKHGVSIIMVANRTYERAEALAGALGAHAVKYDEFPERLAKADIVVSSTAAPHAVIQTDAVRAAAARRKGRPMFLIDLAMPRDIEPAAGDLDNVFLYNLDDLQVLVQQNLEGRKTELDGVETIIDEDVASFLQWMAHLQAVPVLNELQRRFEDIRLDELARSRRRLSHLSESDMEAVEQMTRAMVKKMLHQPWQHLRGASDDAALARLQALVDAFGLDSALVPSRPEPADDAREALSETPLGGALA